MATSFSRSILWQIAGLCIAITAGAQTVTPYQDNLHIPYCVVDGKELHLNAFIPTNASEPTAAIVEIHGGWFYGGEPAPAAQNVGGFDAFARHGLAIFSIEYRLNTEGGFPENIRDCRNAIRFIRKNAARFHIDANRIDV